MRAPATMTEVVPPVPDVADAEDDAEVAEVAEVPEDMSCDPLFRPAQAEE
ncbi:hypothetical protein GCM10023220_15250 [Streptomyces ziwulingensis]|uniref:Uncharacterized protein n=1 Tax=Streptomyces ziwulingensis TaxID=1045501 RepID=A0ABP9B7S8_9ACTN